MNKKGFEVAVGTIVLIILGVLVFIFALSIVFKIFGGAEEIKSQIDLKTKSQIESAMMRTNELVSIPFNVRKTKMGDAVTFGMGVKNIYDERDFSAVLSFDGAYYPDGEPMTFDKELLERNWLGNFKTLPSFYLKKYEYKLVPVTIVAYADTGAGIAEKGDYVFNVCIFADEQPDECTKDNIDSMYTKRIYQVVVQVV